MSDDFLSDLPRHEQPAPPRPEIPTLGASTIYRLCEELIALRERNDRQHREFDKTLAKVRDALQAGFNSFAADTQRAYQNLRQELSGEKRVSIAVLNELFDVGRDLEDIVAARPDFAALAEAAGEAGRPHLEALRRWAEAIEVESRKVQAALVRHGIHPYNAVLGSAYTPALHERVGSKRAEGMDANRVAEQVQHGYASQLPEFVLRRARVIVSE
jgi:molecular chaperone GrpE (heat shock protein)